MRHVSIKETEAIAKAGVWSKTTAERLKDSEVKYRRLFEAAQDGILILDGTTGSIEDVNPFLIGMLGYSRDKLVGKQLWEIGAFRDKEISKDALNRLQRDDFIRYDNIPLETKTGKLCAVEFVSNAYLVNDRRVIQCNIRDITKRAKLQDKLQELATHDNLTSLPNRVLLFDRFDVAVANAKRKRNRLAIMSLDLDKFKTVNDTLGHDGGDKVLVAAAGRLTNILRKVDTVARIGGDEFVVLLWEIDNKDNAVKVAQKILQSFRQPLVIAERQFTITISIGVAIFPEDGEEIQELLKKSDESLYRAKESGRNKYQLSAV
jgi:diguanylate cyclase (GGDEF)-like protein/PAS domain S-box-containing protein